MKKEISALNLAIEALEEKRRRYAAGYAAYQQGIRANKIVDDKVSGVSFAWVEEDHEQYVKYDKAIERLGDLKEILADPGVTRSQRTLFDL